MPVPNAGGSGGDSGSGGESGSSGASGTGSRCNPDAPVPRDVIGASERCLDPELLITDLDLLDGKSFVLESGLCPVNEPSEDWSNNDHYSQSQATSLRTLHLRRQGDELELVSAMPTDAGPIVQRSKLEPTGSGFGARNLVVCSATVYDFEDAYEVLGYEAPLVHLAFVPGKAPDELELALAARIEVDEATVVISGTPDRERPTFDALHVRGEYIDGPGPGYEPEQEGAVDPPYRYFFNEPVLAGELSLDDGLGNLASLGRIEREGFLVGFEVDDLVLGESAFELTVSDLAGNAWQPGETYAGVTLAPTDGDLESSEDYIGAYSYWSCYEDSLLSEDELASSPPLSGERSLFTDGCATYFRVPRAAGATTLSFETRTFDPEARLNVEVRAIGADGLATSSTIAPPPMDGGEDPSEAPAQGTEWLEDPEYTTDQTFVSLPTKVSLPLPATGDDLIVRIDSGQALWLDSIVTE